MYFAAEESRLRSSWAEVGKLALAGMGRVWLKVSGLVEVGVWVGVLISCLVFERRILLVIEKGRESGFYPYVVYDSN